MSNLFTREQLEKLTKPEILDLIRKRGLHGYSNLNKPELVNFYLNPPVQSSVKSPGRPPGSGATKSPGKEKGKTKGRAVFTQSKSKTVDYSKKGLSNLTGKQLSTLITKKGVVGYSGKSKGQQVDLLLAKPHREILELTFEKDGVVDRIVIHPTNLSRVIPDTVAPVSSGPSVSTGQAVISNAQILLPQEAFNLSQIRISPRGQVPLTQARVSPRTVMPNLVQPLTQARVSPRNMMPNLAQPQLQPLTQARVSPRTMVPLAQTRVSPQIVPSMPLFQQ